MAAEYFLVLAVCIAVPLVMSFSKDLTFYWSAKRLILSILIPFVPFVLWDIAATARGHWRFNPDHVVGVTFVNLPVEEVLFFVVIPFASIFTWESVKYFLRRRP